MDHHRSVSRVKGEGEGELYRYFDFVTKCRTIGLLFTVRLVRWKEEQNKKIRKIKKKKVRYWTIAKRYWEVKGGGNDGGRSRGWKRGE